MLEKRHVLGGAAVTEEIIPGFKFSVFSYVVSLLRPEIIRELDLPRHGLEILPLDGTFTPMPNGDYLWRVNDHGKTRREIAAIPKWTPRPTKNSAKMMMPMCRFVKPMSGHDSAGSHHARIRAISRSSISWASVSASSLPTSATTSSSS